nr:hypothetical protein [Nitrosomonas nitrosa]
MCTDESKHVVRVVGSYSLVSFFKPEVQEKFLDITADPDFENIFSSGFYEEDTDKENTVKENTVKFEFSDKERDFELKMANHGLIRESFWKDAFTPIFEIVINKESSLDFFYVLDNSIQNSCDDSINSIITNKCNVTDEALLYRYALYKLKGKLEELINTHEVKNKVKNEVKIHLGLNKFGIANLGIAVKINPKHDENFEYLCQRVYEAMATLQEDPFIELLSEDAITFKTIWKNICKQSSEKDKNSDSDDYNSKRKSVIQYYKNINAPRLVISYFQVLAITLIHLFLHKKLKKLGGNYNKRNCISDIFLRGWKKKVRSLIGCKWVKLLTGCKWENLPTLLAEPWTISNQIQNSARQGLPPLRHVVFMYQLAYEFSTSKNDFLKYNQNALLSLGHNVGWSTTSSSTFFPPFNEEQHQLVSLTDSSYLENSCCLIFPQGLVVVTPPNQTLYLGGHKDNQYSISLPYSDYWTLIFKLFIRVIEARLLIRMLNGYLLDIHRDYIINRSISDCRSTLFGPKKELYNKVIHIGWLAQRTTDKVITPELSRFSFVRKKIACFMEGVNFQEHMTHIQSEIQKLDSWMNNDHIHRVAELALIISVIAILVSVFLDEEVKTKLGLNQPVTNADVMKSLNSLQDLIKEHGISAICKINEQDKKITQIDSNLQAMKIYSKNIEQKCISHETEPQESQQK